MKQDLSVDIDYRCTCSNYIYDRASPEMECRAAAAAKEMPLGLEVFLKGSLSC